MFFVILFAIAVLVGVDQWFKHLAVVYLSDGVPKDFIKFGDFDVLGFRYCENTGAAFSSFSGQRWLLIGVTAIMLILSAIYLFKMKDKHSMAVISFTMFIAGGIGNLIDRIANGYVVDYLEVRMFRFAIFNFADILVVCGVAIYIFYLLFIEGRKTSKTDNGSAEDGAS